MTRRILWWMIVGLLLSPGALRADVSALPSRDPGVVLLLLRATSSYRSLPRLERILGRPDRSFLSGFRIYVFQLNDGTAVYVTAADRYRVLGIRRSGPGQVATTLYAPLAESLVRPAPASAPF